MCIIFFKGFVSLLAFQPIFLDKITKTVTLFLQIFGLSQAKSLMTLCKLNYIHLSFTMASALKATGAKFAKECLCYFIIIYSTSLWRKSSAIFVFSLIQKEFIIGKKKHYYQIFYGLPRLLDNLQSELTNHHSKISDWLSKYISLLWKFLTPFLNDNLHDCRMIVLLDFWFYVEFVLLYHFISGIMCICMIVGSKGRRRRICHHEERLKSTD